MLSKQDIQYIHPYTIPKNYRTIRRATEKHEGKWRDTARAVAAPPGSHISTGPEGNTATVRVTAIRLKASTLSSLVTSPASRCQHVTLPKLPFSTIVLINGVLSTAICSLKAPGSLVVAFSAAIVPLPMSPARDTRVP